MYKTFALALGLAAFAAPRVAEASCPNLCSGHGTCGNDDICDCYQDWITGDAGDAGDCRERRCPFELAWADKPSASGVAHALLECAGKGLCDRKTGQCEGFDGYEGKGCRRQTCPNDCSGHGTCEFIKELRTRSDTFKFLDVNPTTDEFYHNFYDLWDFDRARACQCDAKWTDVDCSRRMCPKANYALYSDQDNVDEVQQIAFASQVADDTTSGYISFLFMSNLGEEYMTSPTTFHDGATLSAAAAGTYMQNVLRALPNGVLEGVVVTADSQTDSTYSVTFSGSHTSGSPSMIQVVHWNTIGQATASNQYNGGDAGLGFFPYASSYLGAADTIPAITRNIAGTKANIECAGRGACDYDSGLCECFSGYTGEGCNFQTALI